MTYIEKIVRLKHPGVLRDFSWSIDLPSFGRFNLIYGWNGCGKTTISRILRSLELRSVPLKGEVKLRINGVDVDGKDFSNATIPVRVFNRDFVNESVFPVGGGDVPPIFVVGKESVEKQKEVDRLKALRLNKENELVNARNTLKKDEEALDRHCVERAKAIKNLLRSAGVSLYNDYDKRAYKKRAQQMIDDRDAESYRLDEVTRNQLLKQHRSLVKPKVPETEFQLPLIDQFCDEVKKVINTTVVASVIETLQDDPQLGTWTRDGLILHKDRNINNCLFCEQPLSSGRLATLEAHFSEDYDRFLNHLDGLIENLKLARNKINAVRPPDRAAIYEDLTSDYDSVHKLFHEMLQRVSKCIDTLIETLEEKRGLPFKKLERLLFVPEVDADIVNNLNEIIRRHNKACDDFNVRTSKARDGLAHDEIAQQIEEYSRLVLEAQTSASSITPIEEELYNLSDEITRLEREIVEHRQPADELTEDLRKYLGHDELRLEVKDTGYVLVRGDVPAESLSEGEATALSLLYFLKSLGDRRFDIRQGVVVLDDPVSSLDANALFLAFGFIRQRTQDVGQLFLLTHNFAFFRQVRNWFNHLNGRKKRGSNQRPAQFYMLDRIREANVRATTIRPLDPLLEDYESEYHYLFACVYRASRATTKTSWEHNYMLPNIARRLLEMFLAFRRPKGTGELWKNLQEVQFDEARKVRVLRFVHTQSHGDRIGEPEHDPSLLAEAQSVLNDLLELIKTEDDRHFDAMVGLIEEADAEE